MDSVAPLWFERFPILDYPVAIQSGHAAELDRSKKTETIDFPSTRLDREARMRDGAGTGWKPIAKSEPASMSQPVPMDEFLPSNRFSAEVGRVLLGLQELSSETRDANPR